MRWSSASARTAFAGVCGADTEVVHPACSAEAHLAGVVEPVVAQPVVRVRALAGGHGFGGGAVGVAGSSAVQGATRAALVVVASELVELALELDQGPGGGSGSEPARLGLVEPFDLALGLSVAGGSVLLAAAEQRQEV